jgi:hypothetical protein
VDGTVALLLAIATGDHIGARRLLDATPPLATVGLARRDECFLEQRFAQVYEGDTTLHAAAFSYDAEMARDLLDRGADVRARNRRGAEPLHAAVMGNPESMTWDPDAQRVVILCLIRAGADPNARAAGGVTPLHRAVRNRCSAAVVSGKTNLPRWSGEAKAEQRIITERTAVRAAGLLAEAVEDAGYRPPPGC